MSQNYSGRLAVVLSVLIIALLAIFWPSVKAPLAVGLNFSVPFSQKVNLKPGIDIRGGTSLLYEIKSGDQAGNTNLAQEMVAILKQRVDPSGLLNLVWRPHGSSQIEIQMPFSATSGETTTAQEALDKARGDLELTNIRVADAVDAIEGKNGKTPADLDKLAAGSADRKKVLSEMAAAYAAMKAAEANLDVPGGAAAKLNYEKLQSDLADTNLSPAAVETVFSLRGSKQAQLDALTARWAGYPARAQALAAYVAAKEKLAALGRAGGSLESAADLKRALRGSGVLEFHILPRESDPDLAKSGGYAGWRDRLLKDGPRYHTGDDFKWFEVQDPDEFKGRGTVNYNDRTWLLASVKAKDSLDRQSGEWHLKNAQQRADQTGQLEVEFVFDTPGGDKFGNLTRDHVGDPMAIMLDDQVISAPNIQSAILTGTGVITGGSNGFSTEEVDYLVRMLRAGSLPAQLSEEPISERTVGSLLGEDNLRAGLLSCGLGLVVVAVFLISYYYRAGIVAFCAIILNIILILGCMVLVKGTFTLPGIAAIVLTIGTSVDANVLVFERLREEQHRGLPLRMALRNAYDRAFSAIVDSNMTTVITSVCLIAFGTEDVKGFGITLIIGILCSLFTALYVTRTVFGILIDQFGVRQLGSIPLTYPKWDKLLKPSIDWMGLAWIFYSFSAVMIVCGLGLFFHYARAGQLMDIEFASGTGVTFELKAPQQQETVRKWIEDESRKEFQKGQDALPAPSVQRVGNEGTTWEITTPNADSKAVRAAVLAALGDNLKAQRPSSFDFVGKSATDAMAGPSGSTPIIFPLTSDNLSDPQKWPGGFIPPNIKDKFGGGAAIVLRDLEPKLSPNEVKARIRHQLLQSQSQGQTQTQAASDQAAVASRPFDVVSQVAGDQPTETVVVLTADPNLPYDLGKSGAEAAEKERQAAIWRDSLVAPLWGVINDAVNHPAELQQVKNFDASVAADTQKDALVALTLSVLVIMAYIWIRFGNLKYGTATVVALLHDVLFTVAALGFAHLLANNWFGDLLRLDPFRINMTVVAGILTIMGYSMIDTIVVFDRIRENRGRYGHVSRQVINDAVNQTLSRTLLTAGTTIIMVAIMYFLGGEGIHGFTFVLLVGILVGTYSSVAIAAPILLLGREAAQDAPGAAREAARRRTLGPRTSPTA
jgi:SecD/SecF fusion protein